MKKIILSIVAFSAMVTASEFQYGSGTFSMTGGMLGLTGSIETDVDTFSLVNRHSNLFSSDAFYGYDFTWYDSEKLKQGQHTYNAMAEDFNSYNPVAEQGFKIPSMDYRLKGLDANIRFGYDVIHNDESDFLGLGVLVGVSMPWIDSSKSDSAAPSFGFIVDNAGNLLQASDYFKDSKTEVMTYKIGPTVNFQKSLISDKLSFYGTASYAYQTGYIKNDYVDSDFTVDGTFQEYNIGLHYTPFTEDYDLGPFTLSPRIYATLGYKYSKWDVDEVLINISGAELNSNVLDPLKTEFGMDSSIGYFGVGYSF